MDAIILNPLPAQVDRKALFAALHVREGSSRAAEVDGLLAEVPAIARPKAIYRMAFIESRDDDHVIIDGLTFASRVLRINLDGLQRVFAYVCTSGRELQAWADGQQDPLVRYYADAVNQAVLRSGFLALQAHLEAAYALSRPSRMNPGSLADWPLSEQTVLFRLLGDVEEAIGVRLTDSLLMTPTKSVSGILFPSEETFASCQLCPRTACPGRRAPYDAGLFERKYRAPEGV